MNISPSENILAFISGMNHFLIVILGFYPISLLAGNNMEGMKFVVIESQKFKMGSPKREKNRDHDEDRVVVRITRSFEIMTTEVTQGQWFEVMKDNPSYFKYENYCPGEYRAEYTEKGYIRLCPNHPVERVSWKRVQEFIGKLNKNQADCQKRPFEASGCYRLPTEAEWELAARGGKKTVYFFGDTPDLLNTYAWYGKNSIGQTHGVGQKDSNPFELHDIYGNVWEWVYDSHTRKLPGKKNPLVRIENAGHVVRGGGWKDNARDLRSAERGVRWGSGDYDLGFRLVRVL